MVGPVGINHSKLSKGGIAVFLVLEIIAAECQILCGHGQPQTASKVCKLFIPGINKSLDFGNIRSHRINSFQGGGFFHRGFTGFNGINDIGLYFIQLL